jgi:hypothetical protein
MEMFGCMVTSFSIFTNWVLSSGSIIGDSIAFASLSLYMSIHLSRGLSNSKIDISLFMC